MRKTFFSADIVQPSLTVLLKFMLGSVFSLAPFTLPLEAAAPALTGVLQSSSSLFCVMYCPISILTGIYLARFDPSIPRSRAARFLCYISAGCYLAFGISALAVYISSTILLRLSLALLSVPFGIFVALIVDHLLVWMPQHPNLAAGLAGTSFTVGEMAFPPLFDYFGNYFPIYTGLLITAALLSASTGIFAFFLRYPIESDGLPPVHVVMADNGTEQSTLDCHGENTPLFPKEGPSILSDDGPIERQLNYQQNQEMQSNLGSSDIAEEHSLPKFNKLTAGSMLRLPSFWLYIFSTTIGNLCFCLGPFYFTIGQRRFGASNAVVLSWFEVSAFCAILACFLFPLLSSRLRTRHSSFQCGSRNLLTGMLLLQALLVGLILPLQRDSSGFTVFASVEVVLRMMKYANFSLSIVLIAEFFGSENAALVFGFGGGICFGLGEGISIVWMAIFDSIDPSVDGMTRYEPWCYGVAVASFLAAISTMLLRRNVSMLK